MSQLVIDDLNKSIASALERLLSKCKKDAKFKKYQNIYFAGDDNLICDYLMAAVNRDNHNAEMSGVFKSVKYLSVDSDSRYRLNTLKSHNISVIPVSELKNIKTNDNLVFFFADTTALEEKEKTIASLKEIKNLLAGTNNSRCVVTVLLPEIKPFMGEVTALSERELAFFMEKVCEKNPENEYCSLIEKICRGFVRDSGLNVTLLKFDNVFAPDRFHTPSFDLKKIISESADIGKIVITDEDECLVTTATDIKNACYAVFAAAFTGLKGHIYNVSYHTVTASLIKRSIYAIYPDKFSLSVKLTGKTQRQYNALNSLVFSKLRIKKVASFDASIAYAVAFITGYDLPDITENIDSLNADESSNPTHIGEI